jgi:HK97 family phage prohead protease
MTTTKLETRNYALSGLEVRAADSDGSGKAAGYAAVFNSESFDLGGFIEVIAPGAFARSLTRAASGDINIFALWSHDNSIPLGSTGAGKLRLSEDERGLAFELDTKRFTPAQLDALADNELRMSFGFMVREQEWRELEDGTYVRTLKDVELTEVSFVINPAYPDTNAAKRSLDDWREQRAAESTAAPETETTKTFSEQLNQLRQAERRAMLKLAAATTALRARGSL